MAVISPLVIEPMLLTDVPTVHEIELLSFSTPWPAHAFEQELTGNRMARYLVARAGERVVGFGGIWLMVDEAHITTFGVHPEWRRRGVGRQLLLALAQLSVEMRAARMTLEVRAGNHAAQELYRRFGFIVAGRRARYYTDDGEDALVMTTPALAGPRMQLIMARERELMAE